MSTVTLPGVGPVEKKWVYVGGAAVVAIVGYYAYMRRDAGVSETGEVIEETPDTGEISTDSGYGNVPGSTGYSGGSWSNVDPDLIDTIQEWTADVVAKLEPAGWEQQFIYNTIGKWIAREGLSATEKALILAAVAASGQPPGGPYPILSSLPTPTPTTPTPPRTPIPTPLPPRTPAPAPVPTPPKPAPASYATVTVVPYTKINPPWASTMWGIAKHYGYGASAGNYVPIWNDPKNATLRNLRKDPRNIRSGDRVYVKLK